MIARLTLAVALLPCELYAQQQPLTTVDLKQDAVFAFVDRPGDLYVGFSSGEIRKFDKDGKALGSLDIPSPELFEAGDGTRSFGFDRDKQTTIHVAYDLSSFRETPVHPEFAFSPWLVCPSRNELWILDSADVSLKKTKGNISAISFESSWTSKPPHVNDIMYMREYLNFLFILEKGRGIHILNSLGREVRVIEEPSVASFNFLGEELYYKKGTDLLFVDLYTTEKRTVPLPAKCDLVVVTDERMILVDNRQIIFYDYKP